MTIEFDTLSYTLLTTIAGAAALLSIRNSKSPDIHPLLLNTQSDVSRLRHPGESAIYRSRMYPMGNPLCSTFDRSIRTMADFYKSGGIEKNSSAEFLSEGAEGKTYATFGSIGKRIKPVYQGLRAFAGVKPQTGKEDSFVGIYAKNSLYTVLTEIACHSHSLVTIPVSSYASTSHLSNVIEKTSLKVLIVEARLLSRALSLGAASLKHIVVIGSISAEDKSKASQNGIELIEFEQLENVGKEAEAAEPVTVANNDLASIYFAPSLQKESKKGVMMTQKNLLSVISSYLLVVPPQQRITAKDRLLMNLPIDNVYGHILLSIFSFLGASIAFGDEVNDSDRINIETSLATIAKAQPTVLASGPAFLHQVKQLIESRYGESFLFKRGYNIKKEYLSESRLIKDCKYDMLVFRDIRQKLFGNNLRLIYIDNDDCTDSTLTTFLRAVLTVQTLETFNLAEATSSVAVSMFYDYNADPAAKGAPLPCNEIKLIDVPENSLASEDIPNPRGELWVRGNNVFAGYYKDNAATSEILDSDGWLNTGYFAEILPNGTLKIIGNRRSSSD